MFCLVMLFKHKLYHCDNKHGRTITCQGHYNNKQLVDTPSMDWGSVCGWNRWLMVTWFTGELSMSAIVSELASLNTDVIDR